MATAYGKGLRQILLRYRDGARISSGTYLTDNMLFAPMKTALRTLTDAGFTLHDALSGLSTIDCYVVGFTIEEQAAYPRPSEFNQQYEPTKRAERIDSQMFPLALAVGEELFSSYG